MCVCVCGFGFVWVAAMVVGCVCGAVRSPAFRLIVWDVRLSGFWGFRVSGLEGSVSVRLLVEDL